METRIQECRKIETSFKKRWPISDLHKMKLEEFTDVNNPDTFCYWVERLTIRLGSIKGHPSIKFNIYKRKESEKIPGNYDFDDIYSWSKGLHAENRNQAFKKVQQWVIETATAASEGRFEDIDKIGMNHLFKWKIAALYSNEKLLPIFKKDALIDIAKSRGIEIRPRQPFSEIYEQLMEQKPPGQNIYRFAMELLKGYHYTDEVAYYILGSKYGGSLDMLPSMINEEVVATGFSDNINFISFLGLKEKDLEFELKALEIDQASVTALKHFLRLKPGDRVAIKSSGTPSRGKPSLVIVAYAVVVERDGQVYFHDEQNLGHCINVEFIETGIHRNFELGGYAQTIHAVTDPETIDLIFGEFVNDGAVTRNAKRRRRRAGGTRNLSDQSRRGSKPYVAKMKHNQIQEKFIEYLRKEFGEENVELEHDFVDVKLNFENTTTLFEIKPFALAEDCIRQGLGQLLSYAHFDENKNPIIIRIVGPNKPDKIEKGFINYLKEKLAMDFDYEPFDMDA